MTMNTFVPGGMTNLYDWIGFGITDLEKRLASWEVQPNVLVIVMTDGGENSSRTYSAGMVRHLIRTSESKGWTFVYLGPPGSALQAVDDMGFQLGNVKQFDSSKVEQTMSDLSSATKTYWASGDTATTSNNNYFG